MPNSLALEAVESGGFDVEAEGGLAREFGEELLLEFRGVGEVIGVGDVADGAEGFEEGGRLRVRLRRSSGGRLATAVRVTEQAFGEGAEFEFVEEGFDGLVIARREHEVVPGDCHRHVDDDGGEFLGEQGLVGVGFDEFLLFAFELGGVGDAGSRSNRNRR